GEPGAVQLQHRHWDSILARNPVVAPVALELQLARHDSRDSGRLARDSPGTIDRIRGPDIATETSDAVDDPHIDVTVVIRWIGDKRGIHGVCHELIVSCRF